MSDLTNLPFSDLMGLRIVSVTPEKVMAELPVRPDLCTRPAVLHGGAVMAFADTLGAVATVANLGEGFSTTVLPAANAGASFHVASSNGEFHGVSAATTPRGSSRVKLKKPGRSLGRTRPSILSASPAK